MLTARFTFLALVLKAHVDPFMKVHAQGTGEFYPIYTVPPKCVKDCQEGSALDFDGLCGGLRPGAWVPTAATVDLCCSSFLNWSRYCVGDSTGEKVYSNKYYAHPDWSEKKCVKDCNPAKGPPCMGNPPDEAGVPPAFFTTAAECCATKVWWAPDCESNTYPVNPTAPTYPPTYPPTKKPITYPPTYPPTYGSPTYPPTYPPTVSPTPWTCKANSECNYVCESLSGECIPDPNDGGSGSCPCDTPKTVPDKCEVDLLIEMMELAVRVRHELIGGWTRAAFHDAGTFDQNVPIAGANGCLINDDQLLAHPDNSHLANSVYTLQSIKDSWNSHEKTCLNVTSADIIQFGGYFATTRQTGTPGLTEEKRENLKNNFEWGRQDEVNCIGAWGSNLAPCGPGPSTDGSQAGIVGRCVNGGFAIKRTMMDINGFTAEEATVLIGAHTIGLMRGHFGPALSGPWVENGADNFTPDGPVFDNAYFDFLINRIPANTCPSFGTNIEPFNRVFPALFRVESPDTIFADGVDPPHLNFMNSDIALAFPSELLSLHPHFDGFSRSFANDNDLFISKFFETFDKMSKLGVNVPLSLAGECQCMSESEPILLTVAEIYGFARSLGDASSNAVMYEASLQHTRRTSFNFITEEVNVP